MKEGLVRLGDYCRQDRTAVRPGERPDLRYIGLESIEGNTGLFQEGELSKTPEVPQAISFHFGPSHVLYGKLRPYLNKVALPDFEGKCSTEVIPLCPSPELDRRYLAYFLRSASTVARISERTAGARMPRADMDFVLGLHMPLPPLDEQRRTADLLSRAEGIVRLRREAQKKARAIIPALFLDMFGDPAMNPKGWDETSLRDLVSEFRYGTSQKSGDSGFPVLRIPNVIGDGLDPSDMKLVAATAQEVERLRLRQGDLLFVRTNGNPDYVGRSAVFEPEALSAAGFDSKNCVFASYLIRGRMRTELVRPAFAQAFLSSHEGRRRLREQARTSAGQYNVNIEGLSSIRVPMPHLDLQVRFEGLCQSVRGIVALQTEALGQANATFRCVLARAFSAGPKGARTDPAEDAVA